MKKQDQHSVLYANARRGMTVNTISDSLIICDEMNTMWDVPTLEQRKARTDGRIKTAYTDRSKSQISDTAHIQFSIRPEGNRHERRKAMSNKIRRNKRKHQRMFVGVPR